MRAETARLAGAPWVSWAMLRRGRESVEGAAGRGGTTRISNGDPWAPVRGARSLASADGRCAAWLPDEGARRSAGTSTGTARRSQRGASRATFRARVPPRDPRAAPGTPIQGRRTQRGQAPGRGGGSPPGAGRPGAGTRARSPAAAGREGEGEGRGRGGKWREGEGRGW